MGLSVKRVLLSVASLGLIFAMGCGGGGGTSGNVAPVAQNVAVNVVKGDGSVAITFSATDANNDPLTYGIVSQPLIGTAAVQTAGTGTYTFPSGFAGVVTFTYIAHDGKLASVPATVTVTVANDTLADPYLVSAPIWLDRNIGSDTDYSYQGISADGRYVAFTSGTTDLLASDANGNSSDVFVRDMATGDIELISQSTAGVQSNNQSQGPIMSDDGNYVLFSSDANNLVAGDTNVVRDIFLRDRVASTTVRISVAEDSTQGNNYSYDYAMSRDARYIAFTSAASNLSADDTDGNNSVFLLDRTLNDLTYIAQSCSSTGMERGPAVNGDGSMVVFKTSVHLVSGPPSGHADLVLWKKADGSFTRVNQGPMPSIPDGGGALAAISADGSKIAFISGATNLIAGDIGGGGDKPALYVYDVASATVTRNVMVYPWAYQGFLPALSTDGRYLVYKGGAPAEGGGPLYLWKMDMLNGTSTLVGPPAGSNGGGSYLAISPEARYVAFVSGATNVVPNDTNGREETFWVDTWAGTSSVRRVSEVPPALLTDAADGDSWGPACSSDGRYVVYATDAGNVTPVYDNAGNTDIVLHDTQTGSSTLLTVNGLGIPVNNDSDMPSVSDNGGLVVFLSSALDIAVDEVTASRKHIYLKNTVTGATTLLSKDDVGTEGNNNSDCPHISADGSKVVFASQASNLTADTDNNAGGNDIYACDVATGVISLVSKSTTAGTGNGVSTRPWVRDIGTNCVFESGATDLIAGDTNVKTDIYKVNLTNGNTTRVSVGDGSPGAEANGDSTYASMNAGSNIVAFLSLATNLTGDTIPVSVANVFIRDIPSNITVLVSVSTTSGTAGNGNCYSPVVSPDGKYVVFASAATDLIAGDTNGTTDIFVYELATGIITRIVENAVDPVISNNGVWIFYTSQADNNVYRTAQ